MRKYVLESTEDYSFATDRNDRSPRGSLHNVGPKNSRRELVLRELVLSRSVSLHGPRVHSPAPTSYAFRLALRREELDFPTRRCLLQSCSPRKTHLHIDPSHRLSSLPPKREQTQKPPPRGSSRDPEASRMWSRAFLSQKDAHI